MTNFPIGTTSLQQIIFTTKIPNVEEILRRRKNYRDVSLRQKILTAKNRWVKNLVTFQAVSPIFNNEYAVYFYSGHTNHWVFVPPRPTLGKFHVNFVRSTEKPECYT